MEHDRVIGPADQQPEVYRTPSKSPHRWSWLGWIVLLGGLVGIMAFVVAPLVWSGTNTVHVVNGTDVAYRVAVGDQSIMLAPNGHGALSVPNGSVTVKMVDGPVDLKPQTIQIEQSAIDRLLGEQVFVINPDRAAVLHWEQGGYYDIPAGSEPPVDKHHQDCVYTGESFYTFENIEYPFEPLPDEIHFTSDAGTETRRRIGLFDDLDPVQLDGIVYERIGAEASNDRLKQLVRFNPASSTYVELLAYSLPPDELVEFLDPFADRRPVLTACHRALQNAKLQLDPEADLVPLYRAHLQSDPENPALQYLLGRLLSDADEAEALYRKAAAHPDAPLRVYDLLWSHLMGTDRAEEAVEVARTIVRRTPEQPMNLNTLYQAQAASGDWSGALQTAEQWVDAMPLNFQASCARMNALARLDRSDEMKSVSRAFLHQLMQSGARPRDLASWRTRFAAWEKFFADDLSGFADRVSQRGDRYDQFLALVAKGDVTTAIDVLAQTPNVVPDEYLFLAVLAHHHGENQIAQQATTSAAALLQQDILEYRTVANWLTAEQPPEPEVVFELQLPVELKVLALLRLGQQYPKQREAFFGTAQRLDYCFDLTNYKSARAALTDDKVYSAAP